LNASEDCFRNGWRGMRQVFSKADLRQLSLVLAIVLWLASVLSTAGFVVVFGPSQPEFTVNICQPIQMFDRASNTLFTIPATVLPEFVLRDLGSTAAHDAVQLIDYRVAPDTPPPKTPI
jgi:hypothetical protein